ncbi:MAG: hypothetical protein COW01_02725 [Bdellovibrionales bacterium CG12_big_fil_rev_8_21_14_0_65_38_15]|nr:MAG: hypothetical protein COW79_08390 [Bdellovibrionales bacterium CG22_combo_CG10-13_8_21_14_all_38_13]PIQ57007.1 MAG: hypothetical protein COW01_02725 [Bdellovibrionales bacterium CG12_big_fil_rev_8_21_14_0_65_38_15]PIR29032.1 MAG: hypothetical protein COV38_12395 [Bdellovibrionales bacterium CG11_big_fil_rev_8_21_14_0_20_38_13]
MKTAFLILFLVFISSRITHAAVDCQTINQQDVLGVSHSATISNIFDVAFEADLSEKILFSGEINKSSVDRLIRRINKYLAQHPNQDLNITITLDSGGGNVNEALRAIREIDRLNRKPMIQIDTKVGSHNSCESACTLLFTAGEKRYASERAKFGFHSPKFVRGDRGDRSRADIEDLYRRLWLKQIRSVDTTAAQMIQDHEYLLDYDMSYVRARELTTGYVTDLL